MNFSIARPTASIKNFLDRVTEILHQLSNNNCEFNKDLFAGNQTR